MDRMQTSNKEQKYLSIAAKLEGMTFLFSMEVFVGWLVKEGSA